MGVEEKVFSWVTLVILACGSVNGKHVGLQSLMRSKKPHKTDSYYVNEPQTVKSEHLDQAAPISLICNEKNMTLIVKADLHKNGILLSAAELLLGQDLSAGPACKAFPLSDVEYAIQASLHECGTMLTIEEDSLVYSNVLTVSPMATSGIIRTSSVIIPIACHYQRRHFVSSGPLYPSWNDFASTTAAMDLLDFSLRLMAADGHSKGSSKNHFLGELLRVEASVNLASHVPLRIFIDTCIATMDPDVNSEPRYAIIKNHGCLSDAKVKGSHAQFEHRSLDEKLQITIDAFVFPEGFPESEIYITCQLKVTAASQNPDAMSKACSYVGGRWQSVDGQDSVCSCCDSTCQGSEAGVLYTRTLGLGPIGVVDKDKTG
ncbi:zona pellucida sperm-binding protein 3-like isoform X4 [Conger conger]|uniref:zona pellucida sperm-binding protein 3-like isoform X4 n=2 Tax=Conger conger TaxID=82655 RepID=UPI002A5A8FBA|nr:zona pellucida sperm-binding protein 3-like isoform X4 [Conger conger]